MNNNDVKESMREGKDIILGGKIIDNIKYRILMFCLIILYSSIAAIIFSVEYPSELLFVLAAATLIIGSICNVIYILSNEEWFVIYLISQAMKIRPIRKILISNDIKAKGLNIWILSKIYSSNKNIRQIVDTGN